MKKLLGFLIAAIAVLCWLNALSRLPGLILAGADGWSYHTGQLLTELGMAIVFGVLGMSLFRYGLRFLRARR